MRGLVHRARKHATLYWQNLAVLDVPSPPFLVLFINSICNMKCEHCFYWQELNQKDDLTLDEIVALSRELGPIRNLNLSGGEPFLRKELGEIVREFVRNNGVEEVYVPSNGWFTDRTVEQVRIALQEPSLRSFTVELSLDGTQEFHDQFRVTKGAFKRAMETYDALEALSHRDPRLQIHAISVATHTNMAEIKKLTTYLFERCPDMGHHNLAIIRGERKDPTLRGPMLSEYRELYAYLKRLWAPRERSRVGSIVEPMLQWAKLETLEADAQVIPCRAGVLSAVVFANGDVGVCEQRPPIGNLRTQSFREIWRSARAHDVRASISARECSCTNEIFLWPSIVFQPVQLARAMKGARVWEKPSPLRPEDRATWRPSPETPRVEASAPPLPPPVSKKILPVLRD
ncbi:MAG: radical SAM protein [Deltaproteobacteria bacterium]|nr:radical SAM protein [Deltaproteobacteria bacterium]